LVVVLNVAITPKTLCFSCNLSCSSAVSGLVAGAATGGVFCVPD